MKGLSSRNLKYMQQFSSNFTDLEIVQQLVAQLPWGHITHLMGKIKDTSQYTWYTQKTIENGWSRNVLVHQIESGAFERSGKTISNFSETLPKAQSDLVSELVKDPYNLEFLDLGEEFSERDLEKGLLENLKDFLLELGMGFAYVGSQYPLKVSDKEFYLDLLFYHIKLKCYVVIELKKGEFKPEYAGKMNFYLNVVDDKLRDSNDHPSVGLILCKDKDHIIAEYSVQNLNQPMGIASYELTKRLPKELKGHLPTTRKIQETLENDDL